MYYVKIIEDGVLKKHIITGQKNKVITLPQNVHTVVSHCFDPWYPELLPAEDIDDLYNWDDFCMVEKVIIPKSVKRIERYAFVCLPNLKSFEVEEGCPVVKLYNDSLLSIDGKLLLCCPPQKQGDFTVPYGVETICENAFEWTSLSHVFLPSSVQAIEDDAFICSHNLEEIYIPSSVTHIGERAFEECSALTIMAAESSFAIEYAKENKIAYECVDEATVLENAKKTKEEYWISCRNEHGVFYRKRKLGYAYNWNGYTFYSNFVMPKGDIAVTEKKSGRLIPCIDKIESRDIEDIRKLFDGVENVMTLPTEDEI